MDGRRHSVDIPISRTLLALRRVRSLRDPSTNSMSKFSALVDNLNWETNSTDGFTLGFVNGCEEGAVDDAKTSGLENLGLYQQREEIGRDQELHCDLGKPKSMLISGENSVWVGDEGGSVPIRTKEVVGSGNCRSNHDYERDCSDFKDNGLELTCVTPSSDQLEGVGSCNEQLEGSLQADKITLNASNRKSRYRKQIRSSRRAAALDIMSRAGSPCLSVNDVPLEGSSHGASLVEKEDVVIVDGNDRGCGISCCWSRTPKFRERNLPYDVEVQPLLSGEIGETRYGKSLKHINSDIKLCSESPRIFSQKFRPKSFNELVGQNGVVRSLLSAISNGNITPFYLFYGPRGTGKTSASRIFAAALNCLSLYEHRPCGVCRECLLFFSGRSTDVKEVDSVRINRMNSVRLLLKNAAIPPVSSCFKVFIIDECHLLRGETWATFFNNIDNLSRHVVFIMITPDVDKLPRSALTRSLRYHFAKIKEADIASRLGTICMEEGLDFDQVALDFVATKSNGSLRDAEMMLEQLSLLGKRITISLAYELIGIVSEDELLELLDLALSSDTSNTIRRARELMRSRIDPMQLTSQLANLVMDILAGKCQEGTSEIRRKFFGRCTSEADMQQLSHALKILSEAEKQLRTSKNQTTWLTVALLQLSSVGSSFLEANDSGLSVRTVHPRDREFASTSSTGESLKHLVTCACDGKEMHKIEMPDCKETLECIWKKATGICESTSLKSFLRKQGQLSSVCFNNGLAVAELEFRHPDYVAKAEKSWKLIASALQSVLGCNVEIRINLVICAPLTKYAKVKKLSFSLFGCSRRMLHESQSNTGRGTDPSDKSDFTSEKAMFGEKYVESCSSDYGSQVFQKCCSRKEVSRTLRNSEGNSLSVGTEASHRLLPSDFQNDGLVVDSPKEEGSDSRGCFPRTLKLRQKQFSSDSSQMICLRTQPANNLSLSIPRKTSDTYFHVSKPYIFCNSSNNHSNCSRNQVGPREDTELRCWRTPTFPFRKAWQLRYHPQRTHFVKWVLPCAAAK